MSGTGHEQDARIRVLQGELEALQARYELLSAASPNAFYIHDGQTTLEVGGAFEEIFGYAREEAVGQPVLGPWIDEGAKDDIRQRIRIGFQGRYRTNGRHKDGSPVPVELSVRELSVRGQLLRVVVVRDLRDELASEARVAEGDARFRTLLEVAFDGMVVHRGGYVLESNEGFARMCGYTLEEVIGMTPGAVVTPESVAVIAEKIRTNDSAPYVVEGVRRNGEHFPMQIQGRRVPGDSGTRITGFRDLTEQRRAEAERQALQRQLLHAQKLEGLGVMAGGIAHDFNNLLTVILGNAELALGRLPPDDFTATLVGHIQLAATRAAALTRQMLAYSGRLPGTLQPVDLLQVVEETQRLMRVVVPSGARLDLDLPREPVVVRADRSQVGQVVMNLVTNAAEALSSSTGCVLLRVRAAEAVEELRALLVPGTELPAAPLAIIEVQDDGVGIAPEVLDRMFDPFFTTRFDGRGLGLATVLGIVKAHQGAIAVDSEPGRGTRVTVVLPRADGAPVETSAPARGARLSGLALVVDDERAVGAVTTGLLARVGMRAEHLASGEALLARLESGVLPRVVLLDRVMPGMGGDAALALLRERWPDLPVLVVSGREQPDGMDDPATGFLPKPFTQEQLVAALVALQERAGA